MYRELLIISDPDNIYTFINQSINQSRLIQTQRSIKQTSDREM